MPTPVSFRVNIPVTGKATFTNNAPVVGRTIEVVVSIAAAFTVTEPTALVDGLNVSVILKILLNP
jgi:hypothetical protein